MSRQQLTVFLLLTLLPFASKASVSPVFDDWPRSSQTDLQMLFNTGFVVAYSNCWRSPVWVSYELTEKQFFKWPRRKPRFKEDRRTHSFVTPEDYWHSGYQRGHLAPAYALWAVSGKQARKQSYLMSNIVPQRSNLNQKLWQRLEEIAMDRFTKHLPRIRVFTGPVYDKPVSYLDSGLRIPARFFKIFVAHKNNDIHVLAFLMPQQVTGKESLDDFLVSIDDIELQTGLDFFPSLPQKTQQQIESVIRPKIWKIEQYANLPGRY